MISTAQVKEVRLFQLAPTRHYEKTQNNRRRTRQTNLENIFLREKLVDENGWQHYVFHQADTNVHYIVPMFGLRANGIEISMILPPQHRFKLQLILSSVAKYLFHVLQ